MQPINRFQEVGELVKKLAELRKMRRLCRPIRKSLEPLIGEVYRNKLRNTTRLYAKIHGISMRQARKNVNYLIRTDSIEPPEIEL